MRTDEKRTEMKQRLREQFLKKPTYRQMCNRYIETKDPQLLKKLNHNYSDFVNYTRLLSLIQTHVKYKSLHIRERYQTYKQELVSEDTLEYVLNQKEVSELELPLKQWNTALESEDLVNAVSTLSERQQQIVWLLFVEDIPVTEIKKKLKVSQQAISKTKKRALQKIEEQLKEGGEHKGRCLSGISIDPYASGEQIRLFSETHAFLKQRKERPSWKNGATLLEMLDSLFLSPFIYCFDWKN